MISFRYHVVSLSAALLALAAGVVLGAGLLDRSDDDTDVRDGVVTDAGVSAFDSGYASRTAGDLVDDALEGRAVLVVTTPGARAADVRGVTANLEAAGGSVVGQLDLTSKLLDPGGRQFADGVAEQAGAEVDEVSGATPGYARIGAALSRAYLTKSAGGTAFDDTANQLRSAFDEGDLTTVGSAPQERASIAVVVTAPRSSANEQQGASLAALVRALDPGVGGLVVAGPSTSSLDGGLVAAVRSDESASQVSTVDVVDLPAGRVVVALAAARDAAGEPGAWGTSRSPDGSLPR